MATASAGVAVGREDPGAGDGPEAGVMNQAFGRWWGLGCGAAAVVMSDMAEGGLPLPLLQGKNGRLLDSDSATARCRARRPCELHRPALEAPRRAQIRPCSQTAQAAG